MFNYEDIKSIHIELSSNCQAKCPMCVRNRRGGLKNPNLVVNDITIEDFKSIIPVDLIKQLKSMLACGNYGDPIINNDLLSIVSYLTELNPSLHLMIHTNGSARSKSWWKQLAVSLPKSHLVYFALDGLEDTHHLYRIGTSYDKIIENAKAFIESGGKAAWVFIRFNHNQHQVEEARQRAKDLGFSEFILSVSHQLSMPDDAKLNYVTEEAIKNYEKIFDEDYEINCKAFHEREIYIDADMNIWPCCFLGSLKMTYTPKEEIYYKIRTMQIEQYNDMVSRLGGLNNLNARNRPIKEIVNDTVWQNIWN